MNLFIYGAGGHAKVVATAAFETNSYEKIYFLDSAKKDFKFSEKSAIFSLNPEDDLLTSSVDAQSIIAIGGGAFVNPNLSICSDVIVGSGSVVINDISEPGIYAGVPANKIK